MVTNLSYQLTLHLVMRKHLSLLHSCQSLLCPRTDPIHLREGNAWVNLSDLLGRAHKLSVMLFKVHLSGARLQDVELDKHQNIKYLSSNKTSSLVFLLDESTSYAACVNG